MRELNKTAMKTINADLKKFKVPLKEVIDFLTKKVGKRKDMLIVIDRDSDERLSITGLTKSHNFDAFYAEELAEVLETRQLIIYVRRVNNESK